MSISQMSFCFAESATEDTTHKWHVSPISRQQAMAMVLRHHYSCRKVSAKEYLGLFEGEHCLGCVTYSIPASYTLCKGVCGTAYKSHVLELSRLVVVSRVKNAASFLVGNSLSMLGNKIVVSYADCNDHVGHIGYIYQATNWIYTGHGNSEPKWIHPDTGEVVSYTRRHIDKKAERLGLHWTDLRQEKQLGKHRYVIFVGDKRFKRAARKELRYPILEYPKGETRRHES